MGCEICGRGSCTRSFHSIEEQSAFDSIADNVKEKCRRIIKDAVNNTRGYYDGNDDYVIPLELALENIDKVEL